MTIDLIAGARPNFMKIAPIIDSIRNAQLRGKDIYFRLVHTGQHYDKNMSENFFAELGIPDPDVNLSSGGGTQAEQTGKIMVEYERLLAKRSTDLCLVVGDVNSTLACAIVAKKAHIRVAHVEAGIRSHDLTMPEEINRLVTDSISDYFFTTSRLAGDNLRRTGVSDERIFFVGNTMIDTLLKHRNRFRMPSVIPAHLQEPGSYLVLTLHRPSNVDNAVGLKNILDTIVQHSGSTEIFFPVHPRTAKILDNIGYSHPRLHLIGPLSYLEFNYLVERSKAVITDSGGITEETTVFGIPCMTLRDSTERPETVSIGTNELLGTDPGQIRQALDRVFTGTWKKGTIPELWDGKAAERIVDILIHTIPDAGKN